MAWGWVMLCMVRWPLYSLPLAEGSFLKYIDNGLGRSMWESAISCGGCKSRGYSYTCKGFKKRRPLLGASAICSRTLWLEFKLRNSISLQKKKVGVAVREFWESLVQLIGKVFSIRGWDPLSIIYQQMAMHM
ncbi:uncharacterized protein LOC130761025 [Actinidia eriantha]|uniref:uncharacterized protein LOC130761025 n=1 Tax=Actinidia eriantha TaxID=165200 RepID=UPI00258580F1|nr:uncharacterized protein LOC130761025 [Actinidia eriantha]